MMKKRNEVIDKEIYFLPCIDKIFFARQKLRLVKEKKYLQPGCSNREKKLELKLIFSCFSKFIQS